MTRSKLYASLTGIGILFGLVIAGRPHKLHSYFSSVVRAEVGSVTVADFQSPQLEVSLQDGDKVFYAPTILSEPADPVILTGSATHTIPFTAQTTLQFLQLTIQFSGEVGSYQSQPCLRFLLKNELVYSILCHSVTDTAFHTVFIPVGSLGTSQTEGLTIYSQLPENVIVTLSDIHQSIWFLTQGTEVRIKATDVTQLQVVSSVGTLEQDGEHFVLQPESLPENKTVQLVVQASDQFGNTTEVQQLVHRVAVPPQTNNTVQYFSETNGSYHAVLQVDPSVTWYQPMYIKNSDASPITSRNIENAVWHPLVRYSEPESLITHSKELQLFDSFLQPYPLIETE